MGAYAEMAVRTGTHRAMRHGHATALTDANIDLVTVRGSGYTCDLCAPWVGKVLSLTGKTPTGKQRLQHALRDGVTVEVDVAGTVEQARDAGLFHPNCGHNYAAFFPGLTTLLDETPEDDGTYAASQFQRKLEREIRVLKRELAVTNQKTDVQRLRAGVRSRQKQIRQLQQQYPALTRKYHREQPAYDLPLKHHQLGQRIAIQPKTVTAPVETLKHTPSDIAKGEVYMSARESLSLFKREQVTPELVDRARRLAEVKSDLSDLKDTRGRWLEDQMLEPDEVTFLERFEALGHRAKWIPRAKYIPGKGRKPTSDFIWLDNGNEITEQKSTSSTYKKIKGRIQGNVEAATKQGIVKDVYIIDIGQAKLRDKVRRQLSEYNIRVQSGYIRKLFIMSENGTKLEEIILKKN